MASHQTLKSLSLFVECGHSLNLVPFRLKRNTKFKEHFEMEINISRNYIISTAFAISVLSTVIILCFKELIFYFNIVLNEDTVFVFFLISASLIALGPQLWVVCKMESIVSLANTFVRFNQHLCKFINFPVISHLLLSCNFDIKEILIYFPNLSSGAWKTSAGVQRRT